MTGCEVVDGGCWYIGTSDGFDDASTALGAARGTKLIEKGYDGRDAVGGE